MLHYTDDQQQMLPEVIRKFLYEFTDVDYPSVVVLLLYFINFLKKKGGSRLQQTKIQTVSYLKNLRKAVAVFCFHIVRLIICCFWSRVPRVTLLLLFIGAPPADTTFLARCYEYCSSYRFCFRHII